MTRAGSIRVAGALAFLAGCLVPGSGGAEAHARPGAVEVGPGAAEAGSVAAEEGSVAAEAGSVAAEEGLVVAALAPVSAEADTLPPPPEAIPGLLSTEEGRAAGLAGIRARAGELEPPRATIWIQLLAVAERTGPAAGSLAAAAVLRREAHDGPGGATLLDEGLEEIPEEDRPALLALAAHLVDAVDPPRAARYRERLVEMDAGGPEEPEARLRLARYRAGPGGDREGAVRLLEEMIVRGPNHPVAPEARRLLEEIRRGGAA